MDNESARQAIEAAREWQESDEATIDPEIVEDLIEELEARLNPWQPIETAPKDGRVISVFNEGEIVAVKWRYDDSWGGVWGSEDYIQDGSIFDDALIARNPTHWMPLPDPPKGEAQ